MYSDGEDLQVSKENSQASDCNDEFWVSSVF